MTDREDITARADQLGRRRARMLPFLAIIYLSQQASYFGAAFEHPGRTVDHVRIGAWLVLSVVLLAALATKGFWFHARAVRDLVDDEHTRANRLDAMRAGFLASMLTGIVLYVVAQLDPIPAHQAIHLTISLGLGAALVRFGMLERRAYRDG